MIWALRLLDMPAQFIEMPRDRIEKEAASPQAGGALFFATRKY
jgi:hypothetical protein